MDVDGEFDDLARRVALHVALRLQHYAAGLHQQVGELPGHRRHVGPLRRKSGLITEPFRQRGHSEGFTYKGKHILKDHERTITKDNQLKGEGGVIVNPQLRFSGINPKCPSTHL